MKEIYAQIPKSCPLFGRPVSFPKAFVTTEAAYKAFLYLECGCSGKEEKDVLPFEQFDYEIRAGGIIETVAEFWLKIDVVQDS